MELFGGSFNLGRRDFLKAAGLAGVSWLTPAAHLLARAAEKDRRGGPAQSIILLWMAGGPSQLETFDPHPGTDIAAGTKAIPTALKGVQLAAGFEQLADQMRDVSLLRSVVSKEGDHERGTYLMKTGYRPDPTVVHPSIGAICCHELPAEVGGRKPDVPRHISILPNQWPARGGFLGDMYDAFKTGDPAQKVPDVAARVPAHRDEQRVKDLDVVERAFARGRQGRLKDTLHRETVAAARLLMTSEQLKAFDVKQEPLKVRQMYGDTPFGRGCLAARRLIEVGVRCVEVTLDGWDSHAKNHEIHKDRVAVLDPAFAALVRDLKERGLFDRTVVVCMGEFGRTPKVNPLGGRDHWPKGFSVALAGGGIKGGRVLGATDPEGSKDPVDPVNAPDIHATVLKAVGLDPKKVNTSPIGRPIQLSEGKPVEALLG
ncbi:MAG TPA: DUF1501 domain-containing protein [Gemmataceae bacterium]|nr:DUF1501 domain-containing protein [Gemmataceae bacterium]